MSSPRDPSSGAPVGAILVALVVGGGAAAALYVYEPSVVGGDVAPVRPGPSLREVVAEIVRKAHASDGASEPELFDAEAAVPSPRAEALAEEQTTEELIAELSRGAGGLDAVGALALQQRKGKGGGDPARRLDLLGSLARNQDAALRHTALFGLVGDDGSGLPTLFEALRSGGSGPDVEVDLIAALGEVGPETERVLGALMLQVRRSAELSGGTLPPDPFAGGAGSLAGALSSLNGVKPDGAAALRDAIRALQEGGVGMDATELTALLEKALEQLRAMQPP